MAERDGTLVWFRNDLRLGDNPALAAALERGGPVTCLYVLDDETPGDRRLGGAARWWLHHSLASLGAAIGTRGGKLALRRGPAEKVVPAAGDEIGADAVAWCRRYEPWAIEADAAIKKALKSDDVTVLSRNGTLLHEPWTVGTQNDDPYKVYTPFSKSCRRKGEPEALPEVAGDARWSSADLTGDDLADWELLPTKPDWSGGIAETWTPGEAAAHEALRLFLDKRLADYADERNRPDHEGSSRLSPRLRFGELSPHQVWHAVRGYMNDRRRRNIAKSAETFLDELLWREFAYHILYHFPDVAERPLRPEFTKIPWQDDKAALRAWRFGRTGYPIVDAGMRQLRKTGWMHNRVRMITGSFLVKDLLLPWQHGERWFWDELVDADPASNTMQWQWVAGCGTDAAPYFRIFNPVTQGERFDPDGDYVRSFVPELAEIDAKWIHKPWEAPGEVLERAGVTLGDNYPAPIVDHKQARRRALDAFERVKKAA
jgi:deoxyribodipyrimidine photo-lyase